MNWGDLAGSLAKIGLPTLGSVIGGPLGGVIGKTIADALGTEATPEAVNEAVTTDPAAATTALQSVEAEIVKAQAAVGVEQVKQVNETMRAEVAALAASPDKWWGAWRTQLAQVLVLECPVWVGLMVWCIATGRVADLVAASGLLMTWWGARFGVLGVHVFTGSQERKTAITGEVPSNVLKQIVTAIAGRK